MPGGGQPGIGKIHYGGKHNESWVQNYKTFIKMSSIFLSQLKVIN